MSSDAARLEAQGATEVTFDWRGEPLTITLALEAWPLDAIRDLRYVPAVDALLNGQTPAGATTLVDDFRGLSDAMAAAAGVGRLPEDPAAPDQWFGGLVTLLRLLDHFEADVASDLQRFWNVDYARRWSTSDPLTLRQIWTYIRRSDPTSAIARADNGGRHVWTEPDYIMASVYQALTGQYYPGRPMRPDEVERAVEAMQAKAAQVDKLRARQDYYASQSSPAPQVSGAASALDAAMANRRRELGITDGDN